MNEFIKEKLKKRGYFIKKELGKGGFGITYLAINTNSPNNLVVIKAIKDELLQHIQSDNINRQKLFQAIDSFKKEADTLFKIQHPNIVKIYQTFLEELKLPNGGSFNTQNSNVAPLELLFLVMEYIEGKNLKELVSSRDSFLPEAEALGYVKQIGEALTVVHNQRVLHRDIKPENIMVRTNNKEAVLIDFGIARDFIPEITQSQTAIFTEKYAPPEQFHRRDRRGHFTDIYSLAATLYYLLTKKDPISSRERDRKSRPDELIEPKKINPDISDGVNRAILWGMELESSKRPQKVEDWLVQFLPHYDLLLSECNMNYTQLRDLLAAKKWKEADEETLAVMLKATGREKKGRLSSKSIKKFPCTDLCTINQLWVKYSNQNFGFSVQKPIWQSVGHDYKKFGEDVGWKRLDLNKLTFNRSRINASGHFPAQFALQHLWLPPVTWGFLGWIILAFTIVLTWGWSLVFFMAFFGFYYVVEQARLNRLSSLFEKMEECEKF
ncbi:serine/threonine-protein kinase [Nostoc sp. UHCC 0302]|uniref:serine/threonine-protein kinase n=1 Tax=Nostoc sp. UHCC 0302 TaxID=3134896 RepID=UPI00311CDCB3